jgi:hypothetical protein
MATASAAHESGTVVAVAVGGLCKFSVDGESKGEAPTLRLSVPPGTHKVVCATRKGKPKSMDLSVSAGATALATFTVAR